jgi:hypothetical protein
MKELSEIYGVRCDNTDPDFPGGKFKDESTEGADDGTPLQADWPNQSLASIRAPFVKLETIPDNTLDTAVNCQSFNRSMDIAKMQSDVFSRWSLCAQMLFGHDSNNPSNAYNFYETGDTIRDACIVFAESDDTPGIAYLQTDGTITFLTRNGINPCWNFDGTFGKADITPVYPSTPDQVEAIACDGTFLFVAWSLDSGHHYVSAFALNALSGAAAWTRNTLIAKVGGGTDEAVKLIVANSTDIALQIQDGAGGGGSARTTVIITKATGVLVGSGAGSYVSGYGDDCSARTRPVTDGFSIYWLGYQTVDATRLYYILSARTSDPDAFVNASKYIGTFTTVDTWTHPRALVQVNNGLAIISADGSIGFYEPYPNVISVAFASVAAVPTPNYQGNQDVLAVSDGKKLWFSSANIVTGMVINTVVYPVPRGVFSILGASSEMEITTTGTVIDTYSGTAVPCEESITNSGGRLLFDARALWIIGRSGYICRVTL